MEIKVGQKYKTQNNQEVEIVAETPQGFEGKLTVKYNKQGKIPGWQLGHYLDLKGLDGEKEEEVKPGQLAESKIKKNL